MRHAADQTTGRGEEDVSSRWPNQAWRNAFGSGKGTGLTSSRGGGMVDEENEEEEWLSEEGKKERRKTADR